MDAEYREKRIAEIMTDILNKLLESGPRSLEWLSDQYRSSDEVGLCLIAFSRLEAEGLIVRDPAGKWKITEES